MNTDAFFPIEQIIAAYATAVADSWQTDAVRNCDAAVLNRQGRVFEFLAPLVPNSQLEPLRTALAAGDERAKSAFWKLHAFLNETCAGLLDVCQRQKQSGAWQQLNHDVSVVIGLADACDRRDDLALAWYLAATARRAMGDDLGTVEAYARAVNVAAVLPGHGPFLSATHDNMANALMDLGRFDEALEHLETASLLDASPGALNSILASKAQCLAMLGEWKSAGRALGDQIRELEAGGLGGSELAVKLDMNAQTLIGLGEWEPALKMLQRAQSLFPPDDLKDRAINSLLLSEALNDCGNPSAGAAAFEQAHGLALLHARRGVDEEVYRLGFGQALAAGLPLTDNAYSLFHAGIEAKQRDDARGALEMFQQAINLARAAKDTRLALRVKANVAALFHDGSEVDAAIKVASETRLEAAEKGLARPELMVLTTLASLAASCGDAWEPLGPLEPLSRAVALKAVHARVVAQWNLSPADQTYELADPGGIEAELSRLADDHSAYEVALGYLHGAIELARRWNLSFELVNRLVSLCKVLNQLGRTEKADEAAVEISALLAAGKLPLRGQIVAHRCLAGQASTSAASAIGHLRSALDAAERSRLERPPGPNRADFDREFRDVPCTLAEYLSRENQDEAAFDALQYAKGRRLIEALSARAEDGGRQSSALLTAREASRLIEREAPGSVLVDLVVRPAGIIACVLADGKVQAITVPGDPSPLTKVEMQGDVLEREARVVSLCMNEKIMRDLARAVSAAVPPGRPLMIVPDDVLHNLPLHAIPLQSGPWGEHAAIGYSPTAAILRFKRPAGGHGPALVAGDSHGDLPGAADECTLVGAALNTKPLIGQACTRDAIERSLREEKPDIVHFALHGRGDIRSGGRSSLLLANGQGDIEWVGFDLLTRLPWTARLVVFSGCSTGVLGQRHGSQFLSVASAALEAGAASVIASLWPVDDWFARSFMVAFYKALNRERPAGQVDLRLILNEARDCASAPAPPSNQEKRRDGRGFVLSMNEEPASETVYGPGVAATLRRAPFCLYGDPILRN